MTQGMTMTSLTDRYVHAVTTQLPEGQREDIARELRGAIEDSVAASPDGTDRLEAEQQALRDLGHPTALADSYRGEGRMLIGPRYYPAWLRTLGVLLFVVPPLVGGLLLLLGLLDGGSPGEVVLDALMGMGYSALHVVFWVTLGYALAERHAVDSGELGLSAGTGDWDPQSLPEPPQRQVPWADAIWSVVLNAFLLTLLVLPVRLGGSIDGFAWGQVFTDTAYSVRWVLAAGMALSLVASVVVMARGRWTWPVAVANLAGTVLFVGPLVWLAARNDLYAWETLPEQWVRDASGALNVNESATLVVTVAVLLLIALWETIDSVRKADRSR